jgi:hypothetical protein
MGHIVAQLWVQLSHDDDVVSMATKLYPSYSQSDRCKFCIHLRNLFVRHRREQKETSISRYPHELESVATRKQDTTATVEITCPVRGSNLDPQTYVLFVIIFLRQNRT